GGRTRRPQGRGTVFQEQARAEAGRSTAEEDGGNEEEGGKAAQGERGQGCAEAAGNRKTDPTGGCRRGRSAVRFGKRQRVEGGHRPGSDPTSTEERRAERGQRKAEGDTRCQRDEENGPKAQQYQRQGIFVRCRRGSLCGGRCRRRHGRHGDGVHAHIVQAGGNRGPDLGAE
ncbi:unnamed protein product, partial [Ectocarpus fasciculatus]